MAKISPGTMTAAIFAILIGLAGAFLVRQQLSKKQAPVANRAPAARPAPIFVPVAMADLKKGHAITINDIVIQRYSREQYRKSPHVSKQFMSDTTQMTGRTLKNPVKKGEVFAPDSFYSDGMGPSVAELLKPGFRAISIPIKNAAAVQGFAGPGSYVDVLFRSEKEEDRPEITLTLLEAVQVLALGQIIQPGRTNSGANVQTEATVTLSVTPRQAKALKAIEGRGDLSLTLRNPEDIGTLEDINGFVQASVNYVPDFNFVTDRTDKKAGALIGSGGAASTERVTLGDLLGFPEKTKPTTMQVYRAGRKTVVTFDDDGSNSISTDPIPGFISTPIAADPFPSRRTQVVPSVGQSTRRTIGGGT